jgi:hypothetical protein
MLNPFSITNLQTTDYSITRRLFREREKNPKKLEIKHFNENINAKVMTKQEAELDFHYVENMKALKKTSLKPRT